MDGRKDTLDLSKNDCEQGDLSPSKFQRELNLPRSRIHQRNRTRVRWHASIRVQNYTIVVWRLEIRMINDIEELSPELPLQRFADREVLKQREIEVHETGAYH